MSKKVKKANPINTHRCSCGASNFVWVSRKLKVCKECDAEYRDEGK